MAKLMTVFGATGLQGRSVAEALLGDASCRVRAPTGNPDSSEAQSLREKGCEVVEVDMIDKDSLERAVAGSYGVFGDTNYWGLLQLTRDTMYTLNRENRDRWGKALGDVCKNVGVKHLVYCGMEHVEPTLGKPRVNGNGIVERYLDEIKMPNTSIRIHESFLVSIPRKNEQGAYNMVRCGLWLDQYRSRGHWARCSRHLQQP